MREDRISVVLNGEEREIPAGLNVRGLLSHLDLREGTVVVELNREIVRGERYDAVNIEPGDTIELVHFVGGG
jgi:thiamine biosynthesis protein ThiS